MDYPKRATVSQLHCVSLSNPSESSKEEMKLGVSTW